LARFTINKYSIENKKQRHQILTWKTLSVRGKTTGPSPVKDPLLNVVEYIRCFSISGMKHVDNNHLQQAKYLLSVLKNTLIFVLLLFSFFSLIWLTPLDMLKLITGLILSIDAYKRKTKHNN